MKSQYWFDCVLELMVDFWHLVFSIDKLMVRFGTILYQWRGVIGFIVFWIVWYFSRPGWLMIAIGLPFTIIGLILRFWASGYIGKESRSKELRVTSLITNGPYRFIRNPLYLGNFFLTLGILLGMNLPSYFIGAIIVLFWVYYAMIIKAEHDFLIQKFGEKYLSYCKATRAVIPKNFFKKTLSDESQQYEFRNAKKEFQTIIMMLLIYVIIYLRMVRKF